MAKIELLDAAKNVIHAEETKSKAARYSVRASANQRQLDKLYTDKVAYARMDGVFFNFRGGRSNAMGTIQTDGRIMDFGGVELKV